MGFVRWKNVIEAKKVHSFRNDPDNTHQTCMKCGARKVITSQKGITITTYYDKYNNKLGGVPTECKGLYDLLNED